MNRLYVILIMCNVFVIGVLAGVQYSNYQFDKGCEKDTNVMIGEQEYACIKLPGVITEEEANGLK